jgi:hypothetical protein
MDSSKGPLRGLMLGVKVDSFKVEQMELANYFLGCLVRNRMTIFRFWLINVYGPAHHELSENFILELTKFCATKTLSILMGGFQPN